MKKIVILLSLAAIAFAAIGCGEGSEPGSSTTPAGNVSAPREPAAGDSKPAVGGVQEGPTPMKPPG